ncbi:hypothetical protein A8938_3388 [Algoriphagus zhangzhouensis]|uniref:Uncharacterized protein n=1 Tax=Algoriphagus zhangzhouensis TaxID=1073327 RepID=A0A1M7ZI38_9BACT|nr:hypothetical protein A8938_3388 [Algoriphagus zhangzhouensis]SHO64336.1 hypothetical protein SAMN04488108_3383 [Algoriphagus zhangzhouensis]
MSDFQRIKRLFEFNKKARQKNRARNLKSIENSFKNFRMLTSYYLKLTVATTGK